MHPLGLPSLAVIDCGTVQVRASQNIELLFRQEQRCLGEGCVFRYGDWLRAS
jgi:hypothetical protein